ncbi:hypothetical protein ACA910_021235 [Epithemia clementina (nom. ined.)]
MAPEEREIMINRYWNHNHNQPQYSSSPPMMIPNEEDPQEEEYGLQRSYIPDRHDTQELVPDQQVQQQLHKQQHEYHEKEDPMIQNRMLWWLFSSGHEEAESQAFCHGMPMTMYMDGFQWALRPRQRQEQQQQQQQQQHPPKHYHHVDNAAATAAFANVQFHSVMFMNMSMDDNDSNSNTKDPDEHHRAPPVPHRLVEQTQQPPFLAVPPFQHHQHHQHHQQYRTDSQQISSSMSWPAGFATTATPTLPPCLVYLFPTWMLDNRGSFQGAMVFSFLLALLMEILSAIRGTVVAALRRQRQHVARLAQPSSRRRHNDYQNGERTGWWAAATATTIVTTLIYGVQALLGYVLMFLAMTFSLEILGSIVLGLMVGNLLFFRYHDFQPPQRRQPRNQPQQQQRQEQQHLAEQQPLLPLSSTTTSTTIRLRHSTTPHANSGNTIH